MASAVLVAGFTPTAANADPAPSYPSVDDPRYTLAQDAMVGSGMELLANVPRTAPLDTQINSDMAFTRDHVVQGNYNGFNIVDVSDPANPRVRTSVYCPGGQGDVNVYGNLMFTSVESTAGRLDCAGGGAGSANTPNPDRFRGVRIWDISNLDRPVQVGAIQTCRGSHTNRLVEDPNDPAHVYIYNNGTSSQRNVNEAVHTPNGFQAGRCNQPITAANPSSHMIEIIKVPVANPAAASVVKEWRLFADETTGAVNGLQNGPTRTGHPCSTTPRPGNETLNSCSPAGNNYSPSPNTNTCHDITVYPEIGLAAGACQGNGILIDISNPVDPVRLDYVSDENFAYWHSANFNNDGTTVMFTDEWGGGGGARCMPHHRMEWGANAFFTIDRSGDKPKLKFESYYKLPAAQAADEICVAHQANILPVPGRDILIQAWYSGGSTMVDFTDPANPREIGYFDRGSGGDGEGYWSSYWYNGTAYGNGITKGLDVLKVLPTEDLTANEIAAASTVHLDEHNAMSMRKYEWEPSFTVVRAHMDQVARDGDIRSNKLDNIERMVDRAEGDAGKNNKKASAQLFTASKQLDLSDPWQAKLHTALTNLMSELG